LKLPEKEKVHVRSAAQIVAEDHEESDEESDEEVDEVEADNEANRVLLNTLDEEETEENEEIDEPEIDMDYVPINLQYNLLGYGGAAPGRDDPADDTGFDPNSIKGRAKPSKKRTRVSGRQWFRYMVMVMNFR